MLNIQKGRIALNAFDFRPFKGRYEDEHPEHMGRFDEASEELRKFFTLPLYVEGPLAIMSHVVDDLWHTIMQHTPQSTKLYSDAYDGRYLHHQPRSDDFPVPLQAISNTYTEFPKLHGPMANIWFEDIPAAHVIAVRNGQVPDAVQQLKWSGWPGWIKI